MTRITATIVLIAASRAFGQTPPAFEAASVKPNVNHQVNREGRPVGFINPSPGSLHVQNSTLSQCIQWAYNLSQYQVSGPSWMESERFDIDAKAAGPAPNQQLRLMLQTLLKDRFKLTFHRQSTELPGYALVVANGGSKLRESVAEGDPVMKMNGPIMTAERMSMARFAEIQTQPLRSPVVDMTGLNGRYDFTVDISKYVTPDTAPDDMIAALLTMVQQELGLRLDARKLPLDILVVDHAEKTPVEN
jgi:uncharacterized protein (TIGR03435 family)